MKRSHRTQWYFIKVGVISKNKVRQAHLVLFLKRKFDFAAPFENAHCRGDYDASPTGDMWHTTIILFLPMRGKY